MAAAEAVLGRIDDDYSSPQSEHTPASDAALVMWLDFLAATSKGDGVYEVFDWWKLKPDADHLVAASPELQRLADLAATGAVDLDDRLLAISRGNAVLAAALPLVPYGGSTTKNQGGTLAALCVKHRHLLYASKKKELLEECLRATDVTGGSPIDIELSRIAGSELEERASRCECDVDATWSVFGQAFRAVQSLLKKKERITTSVFRMRSERLFRVKLTGEHAIDQGGPFREILSTFVAELESSLLPLLIPTPNATAGTGNHRDCFLLHPRACDAQRNSKSDLHRQMLIFLGQLMGYSLRNSEFISLSLAPLVWKRIVGEPLTFADLQAIDDSVASSLLVLKHIDTDPETFDSIFVDLRFEFLSSDGTSQRFFSDSRVVRSKLIILVDQIFFFFFFFFFFGKFRFFFFN